MHSKKAVLLSNKRISKFFRKLSIRRRLLVIYLVQIIFVVLLSNIIIGVSFNEYQSLVRSANARIINMVAENLRSKITGMEAVTKYPVIRADKPPFTYDYLSYPDYFREDYYQFCRDIQLNSQRLLTLYPYVKDIMVYDMAGNGIYVQTNEVYVTAKSKPEEDWFAKTLEQRGRLCIWGADAFNTKERFYGEGRIYATRAIVNAERIENVGIILASADLSSSLRYFQSNKMFAEQKIGIFDKNGNRVLGDSEEQVYQLISAQSQQDLGQEKTSDTFSQEVRLRVNGKGMMYNYSTTLEDYLCIIETPMLPVQVNTLKKQAGLLVALSGALLIILWSTNQIVASITRPISKLMKASERIKSGDFSVVIRDDGNDELSQFTNSFNAMTREINELIHEVYQKDVEQAQLELQMLRAQINPHFLYNTLESIRSEAFNNGQQALSEMSFLLGKTLRYGITTPDEVVTVRLEMENLQNYIRLQTLRFGDKIEFIVTVEEELLDYNIIKLVLQPLVENAIYHGINSIPDNGQIHILGYIDEQDMIFKVIDNGIGMNSKTCENLNGYINNQNELFNSIGIKNVNRRIQLFYGEGYGVKIDSTLHRGTMITITLPITGKGGQVGVQYTGRG